MNAETKDKMHEAVEAIMRKRMSAEKGKKAHCFVFETDVGVGVVCRKPFVVLPGLRLSYNKQHRRTGGQRY